MGEEQSLEYRTVSGGDSRSSETPVTHIGPFVENEEKPKKKKNPANLGLGHSLRLLLGMYNLG